MTALGTRLLKLKLGDNEVTAELTSAKISSRAADASRQTFAAAAAGGARTYSLDFTAEQDTSTDSVWDTIFSNAGTTVEVVLNPYGVDTATTDTPFFTGTVLVVDPDGDYIGGDANSATDAAWLISGSWDFLAKPVAVTTGSFDGGA